MVGFLILFKEYSLIKGYGRIPYMILGIFPSLRILESLGSSGYGCGGLG